MLWGTAVDVITALLAFAFAAQAQQTATLSDDDKAFLAMVSRPVLYRVRGTDEVRVRKNAKLAADIYKLPNATSAPVVIFIHGGVEAGFPVRPKDWGFYQSWARLAAASGFVGITFNHRLGYPQPHPRSGLRP